MSIYIGSYWPFLLLLFLPVIVYLSRHSLAGLAGWRNWLALVLRIVLLILLVLALANIQMVRQSKLLSAFFLADFSESVPSKMQEQSIEYIRKTLSGMNPEYDRSGLLIFAKDGSFEYVDSNSKTPFHTIQSQVDTSQTNIAGAIKMGIAGLPEVGQKRIVLLTDGNQTLGDALEQAMQAKLNQISIDVVPLTMSSDKEVIMEKLVSPSEVLENRSYEVTAIVRSSQDTTGTVRLTLNGELIREKSVALNKGKNIVTLNVPSTLVKSGFQKLRVFVESPDDMVLSNNVADVFTYIHGIPRVLYLEGDMEHYQFLHDALTKMTMEKQRFHVKVGGPGEMPNDILTLHGYDALIVSNISKQYFTEGQMKMVENAVREGGLGFIMIGGENSFGAGGYSGTPFERILPVDMDLEHKKILPNGALVIVLHTCEFADGNRWAKVISKKAIDILSPKDLAGILYYSWQTQDSWLFNLMQVTNKSKMFQMIDTAEPGDMPSFGPTLQAGYSSLVAAKAMRKHIVAITDGDPTPPSTELVDKIKAGKISISTIVIQPHGGHDEQKMRFISEYTGGKYYRVDDPQALPNIFIKEALTVKRSLIFESEEGFIPKLSYHTDPIRGINPSELPRLYGYIVTTPKPLADVPLHVEQEDQKDPILAHIQHGLGRTVAFTSDVKNRWAAQWVSWDKFQKFWVQLVYWSLRKIERSNFRISTSSDQGQGKIAIDAITPDGKLLNFLQIKAATIYPSGKTATFPITQAGPGRYEGTFTTDEVGTYLITGSYQEGDKIKHFSTGLNISYSAEYQDTKPNLALLKKITEITGGRLIRYSFLDVNKDGKVSQTEWNGSVDEFAQEDKNKDGFLTPDEYEANEDIFLHDSPKGGYPTELWPLFITLFLIIFPLDVFLRRVIIDYAKLFAAIVAKLQGSHKDVKSTPTIERLAQTKETVQKKLQKKSLDLKNLEKVGKALTPEPVPDSTQDKSLPVREPKTESSEKSLPKPQESAKPETKTSDASSVGYTNRLLNAKKKTWEKKKMEP